MFLLHINFGVYKYYFNHGDVFITLKFISKETNEIEDFYDKYVRPYESSFLEIVFTDDEIRRITKFAESKAKTKLNSGEKCHQIDSGKEIKRNITGQMGEWAVEKAFCAPGSFVNWTIGTDSAKYNVPDIPFKNCGVKTVERGKMPIVHKNSKYPEIICIKKDKRTILIAGLATPEVLNQYQSDDMILSPNLRDKGVKSGFYGFHALIHPEKIKKAA